MVLSSLPEAKVLPSGLKLTLQTERLWVSKRLRSLTSETACCKAPTNSIEGLALRRWTNTPARKLSINASNSFPWLKSILAEPRMTSLFVISACRHCQPANPARLKAPIKPALNPKMIRCLRRSCSCFWRSRSATLISINWFSSGLNPPTFSKASLFLNSTTWANREPFNSSSLAFDSFSKRIFCHLLVSPANQFFRIIASFSCSSQPFKTSQEDSKISWAISIVADCCMCSFSVINTISVLEYSLLATSNFSSINMLRVFLTDSLTNSFW